MFFVLEQFLHWHHCHRAEHEQHRPLGYLILLADGLHNFIGGLAVGGAFIVDHRLGVITWLVAAAHEVPQELGDFGVLVHSGWRKAAALGWNFASALTFLLGALARLRGLGDARGCLLAAVRRRKLHLYRGGRPAPRSCQAGRNERQGRDNRVLCPWTCAPARRDAAHLIESLLGAAPYALGR